MSGFQYGDDLSLRSFEEADFQDVELVWTEIQTKRKDFRKLDNLSLQSFDPEDFLSDGEREGQEKLPLDKPLNGVMDSNTLDLLPSNSLPRVDEALEPQFHLIDAASSSDFTLRELDDLDKQIEDLDMAYRALDRSEPSESTNAVRAEKYLQADALMQVNEDLEELYHIIDTASSSDLTLEQLGEIKKVIKDLELNYIDLDLSESTTSILISSPLPTVAQLIYIRLAPIAATDLSLKAQVLLQKGSGELKQVTTKKLGKGKKKAKVKVAWEEKKKKSKGKRFLQWLKRNLSCCSCVVV